MEAIKRLLKGTVLSALFLILFLVFIGVVTFLAGLVSPIVLLFGCVAVPISYMIGGD